MEIVDVVKKLVGPISPLGETNVDAERFENLKAMTALIDELLCAVSCVAVNRERQEHSMRRAGEHAHRFITDLVQALGR